MSSILNVLGMAVAFAAFYIILVQVDYDLNFNKGIKDSEKIFSVTAGDMDGSGKRQMDFCRPLAEVVIASSPNIEFGGILSLGNTEYNRYFKKKYGRSSQLLHSYRLEMPKDIDFDKKKDIGKEFSAKDKVLEKFLGKSFFAPLPENFKEIIAKENLGD